MSHAALLNPTAPGLVAPLHSRRTFRPDIQGLRAVAVILVLLDHAHVPFLGGGFVGVDVFFVISGFLISGHLVDSLQRTGKIDFVGFYLARARRILPAALVTIAGTAAAAFLFVSPLRIGDILRDGIASALYFPNVVFAIRQTDYLAGTAPSPFQHFWSLGVEEQFYIVWPVLLLGVYALSGKSRRWLMAAIAAIAVLSFSASVLTTPVSPSLAFFSPHTRAWEFAIGALVAGASHYLSRVPTVLAQALTWCGVAVILCAAAGYSASTTYPGSAALAPVVGAALIIGFGGRGSRGAGMILTLRPVQFVGAISYSLYLVHWPILVLTHESLGLGHPLSLVAGMIVLAISVPVAWCLFRFVETPFRSHAVPKRRRALGLLSIAIGASAILVGSLAIGGAAAAHMPLASTRTEPEGTLALHPHGTAFVPANLTPGLAAAADDTGLIYRNGCQQNLVDATVLSCAFGDTSSTRVMVLFGDSHAGRWFPALDRAAAALGYRLETFTKSGCRSEETLRAWNHSASASCSTWRNAVVARLVAHPPEVIVLANHLGPQPDKQPSRLQAEWTEGLTHLRKQLPASSQVITLADTPESASSPVVCLSTHLDDAAACSVRRSDALNPSIRAAQLAAARSSTAVIDLTDYLCGPSSCPMIIGHTLVYTDEHHLSATFSRELGVPLTEALRATLR